MGHYQITLNSTNKSFLTCLMSAERATGTALLESYIETAYTQYLPKIKRGVEILLEFDQTTFYCFKDGERVDTIHIQKINTDLN